MAGLALTLPTLYYHLQFSSLFVSSDVSKYKIRCQLVKEITFQGCRLYLFVFFLHFEWHGQNKVGNIAILVFLEDREQLY